MNNYTKRDFPVSNVRRFLEPGPIVLVSSAWKDEKEYHDYGMAYDYGVRTFLNRMLYLE